MKIQLIASAAVAALLLTACSAPADKAAAEAPAAEAPAQTAAGIVLDGAGLKINGTLIAIGATKAATLAAVTAFMESPPVVSDTFSECGAGPMDHAAWDNGLGLMFQNDAFAGWNANSPDLSTDRGIHVGSTLAELQTAYPDVTVEEDSIGWYFAMGEIGGYLDENKSFIQRLDVGVTCDAT